MLPVAAEEITNTAIQRIVPPEAAADSSRSRISDGLVGGGLEGVSGLDELVDGFGREVPGGSSDLCRGPNTAIVFTPIDEVKQGRAW
jgi:hypothetical protein